MQHSPQTYNELQTIRDWVRYGTTLFNQHNLHFGHGTDNAWDEALCLTLYALHLPPNSHPQILDARLTTEEKKTIADLFEIRIEKRLPAPYITQEAWFAGLKFYINENALIPRSSFGELIEKQFSPWVEYQNVYRILDLCTGSGCIAIASALAFPEATVDAVDLSRHALQVAEKNCSNYGLNDRIRLIHSDLWNGLKNERYDLILSNPPYVSQQEMALLPKEYQHEPSLGLFAENEGFAIILQILQHAKRFLTDKGTLIVEVGNREQTLAEKFPQIPFTWLEFERSEGGVFLLTREELT
jgi:ribosomal protein L3 glutamine methyltransferase